MSKPRERRHVADVDAPTRLDEARAGVEAIFAQRAEERERRVDWWRKPVEGWPDRIVMRNIVRDETVEIRLDGDEKRERKPAPAPRMWYEDAP